MKPICNICNIRPVQIKEKHKLTGLPIYRKICYNCHTSKRAMKKNITRLEAQEIVDGYNAVPYGTGSDLHTALSYDVSGNYFDFDMGLLEPGYSYAFKLSLYDEVIKSWQEQDAVFKFKVEEF